MKTPCLYPGCQRPMSARGWCQSHDMQARRYGAPYRPIGKRGFGSMTPETRRALASLGGRTAQAQGTAHRWTQDEASRAGRIGGLATHRNRKAGVA